MPINTTRRLAAVLLTLLFVAPVAFAQDASQVLSLSVGFRTLKNSVTMTDEKRKEIDALEAQARRATNESKFGDALRHYHHAMALLRNQPWTPTRALGLALQVKAERIVFDPGDLARLSLTQTFALAEPVAGKLGGALALTRTNGTTSETLKELKTLAEIAPDFTAHPLIVEAAIPELPDGNYQLTLRLKAAAGDPINKTINIRLERGLQAEFESLNKRAAALKQGLKDRKPELLVALPAVEYRASLLTLINGGQLPVERINLKAESAEAAAMLDQIARGTHPLRAKRGDIHWAYRSAVDDTLQPYRLFVPANYESGKKWPLIVALHGMGGNENSFFTNYANGEIKRIAETRGYLLVCPKGRAPVSMYMGAAETDVLDVLKEVKREYAVDDDRVYLMGHSMGGYGSWSVAANHPDLFAAIGPIAGGGTPFTVAKLKSIAHVPEIVVHGDNDPTVPVDESRKMVKAAQAVGAKVKYIEVPGGNHSSIVVPAFKDIFDWFDAHKRQPKEAVKAAGSGQRQ